MKLTYYNNPVVKLILFSGYSNIMLYARKWLTWLR